jgi:hypothetical protein
MQLICDGVQTKSDVLAESLEQYKEVFVKAQQEMALIDRVNYPSVGSGGKSVD